MISQLSLWQTIKEKLVRTSSSLTSGLVDLCTKKELTPETLQSLERLLLLADFGPTMTTNVLKKLKANRFNRTISELEIKNVIANELEAILKPLEQPIRINQDANPHVILVVGVNGTGKTTTIGKLANLFSYDGNSVMLCAGDTFRAAAIEQLAEWSNRTNTKLFSARHGMNAAGLIFDAMKKAREDNSDVLLIDTAGRVQNSDSMMAELEKIVRVIKKQDPQAPHNTILILDATTGQNAVNQVKTFSGRIGITGLIINKLDGTARGGVLVAISTKHKLPIHFIGFGETLADIEIFNAHKFATALIGLPAQ